MTKFRAALCAAVVSSALALPTVVVAAPSDAAGALNAAAPTARNVSSDASRDASRAVTKDAVPTLVNKKRDPKNYTPPAGAVFNNPKGSRAETFRIVNVVVQAIKNARRGSYIYFTGFLFDSKAASTAMINAQKRGVHVQVVFDGTIRNRQANRLGKALNKDNKKIKKGQKRRFPDGQLRKWGKDRSFVKWCHLSCRDGGDPNHAKWYVFTHTGKAKNVVMVSSSNINKGGAQKGYNDMIILKNRKRLTKDFAFVNDEMAEDSPNDKDGFLQYTRNNVVARFYPKKAKGDPVMDDLNAIRCNKANGGAGRNGKTLVHVAMFRWNNQRGFALAHKLVKLDKQGCIVKVIYGAPGSRVVDILRSSARNGGIELYDSRIFHEPEFEGDERYVTLRTHSKYLLINGAIKGDRSSWSVQTGSANWGRSLHAGDENTITVYNKKTYNKYLANWQHVRRTISTRVR